MDKVRTDIKAGGGSLHPIINRDASPTRMSRTVPKGKSGNGNSLPPSSKATFGLGVGTEVTRMSRTGGKGPSGSTFKLTHTGPGRAPRTAKGSISHDGTSYGVGGVSGGGSSGYGVGGV